jgi:hypothetical protein
MNPALISEGQHPEILQMLHTGNFEEVIRRTQFAKKTKRRWWQIAQPPKQEDGLGFAYKLLNGCLTDDLEPKKYASIEALDFSSDFLVDLSELMRMVLILQDLSNALQLEYRLAATLLECIRDSAAYIEKHANGYPQGSINGKVWFDGAGLRSRALDLAVYFQGKQDDHNELEALFLHGKCTNMIMSHYPNLVGPDMIAIGVKSEHLGNIEQAKRSFLAVSIDFPQFVRGIAEWIQDSGTETDIEEECKPITQSLIDALEGLQRLGEDFDVDMLVTAKSVMQEIERRENLNNKF